MNQNYFNYEDIKKMQEHAKNYNSEPDKRNFLKSINVIEQKMILLNNLRPYEVLNYLDSLNEKKTYDMLNELTYDEIKQLLSLFTSEDKKKFYENFSQYGLVNRFIALDKNAFEHIEEIDLDRKIKLLDSSKKATEIASKTIYETITTEDREKVDIGLTSTEASLIVDEAAKEVIAKEEIKQEEKKEEEKKEEEKKEEEKKEEEKKEEEKKEEEKKKSLEQLPPEQQYLKERNKFFKSKFEEYKQNNPELKDLDINNPELFESLSDNLKAIVENDFVSEQEHLKTGIIMEPENKLEEKDNNLLEDFKIIKTECEQEHLHNIMETINKQENMQNNNFEKTL